MKTELNETWLNGFYENGDEINTYLGYVSISETAFFDGDSGIEAIKDIHSIWLSENCSQQEALNRWKNRML
jgi:hypothetical protein